MTIVRWDPFRDFGFTAPSTWMPPVDIFQTGDHELVLKAELPDMARDDIDINIENFVLTIKGEKKVAADVKDEQYHHVERRYGSFTRSFSLPQTVDNSVSTLRNPLPARSLHSPYLTDGDLTIIRIRGAAAVSSEVRASP